MGAGAVLLTLPSFRLPHPHQAFYYLHAKIIKCLLLGDNGFIGRLEIGAPRLIKNQ